MHQENQKFHLLQSYHLQSQVRINTALNNGLSSMGGSSKLILGLILGGMMAIDMGGPFNKIANRHCNKASKYRKHKSKSNATKIFKPCCNWGNCTKISTLCYIKRMKKVIECQVSDGISKAPELLERAISGDSISTSIPSSKKEIAIKIPPPTTNGSIWDTPFISCV